MVKWTSSALSLRQQTHCSQHLTPIFDEVVESDTTCPAPVLCEPEVEMNGRLTPLTLPPEAEILHLLNEFFSGTGVIHPYIYRRHVFEAYSTASRSKFHDMRTSLRCLLNMIFAFATYCYDPSCPNPLELFVRSEIFFGRAEVLARSQPAQITDIESGRKNCLYEETLVLGC